MDFEPVQLDYHTPQGLLTVTVSANVIHMLWGADSGPQTATGIVEHHRAMIEEVVQLKLAKEMRAPTEIVITEDDLD